MSGTIGRHSPSTDGASQAATGVVRVRLTRLLQSEESLYFWHNVQYNGETGHSPGGEKGCALRALLVGKAKGFGGCANTAPN